MLFFASREAQSQDSLGAPATDVQTIQASSDVRSRSSITSWQVASDRRADAFNATVVALGQEGLELWSMDLALTNGAISISSVREKQLATLTLEYSGKLKSASALATDGRRAEMSVHRSSVLLGDSTRAAGKNERDVELLASAARGRALFLGSEEYLNASSEVVPKLDIAFSAPELWSVLWADASPFLEQLIFEAEGDAMAAIPTPRDLPTFPQSSSKIMCMTAYETVAYGVMAVINQGGTVATQCAGTCTGVAACFVTGAAGNPSCYALMGFCAPCVGVGVGSAFIQCLSLWNSIMR